MPRPKRHHFVPKWYLEEFTDPKSGILHAYDKTTEIYWTPKPKNVMVIKDYYQQKHASESIDPDILETMLGSSIEPRAKDAFKKLLNHPRDLTPDDSGWMLPYLEVQRIRVPRQAEAARLILTTQLRPLALEAPPEILTSEVKAAILRGEITFPIHDSFRFEFMKMVTGLFTPYFARMVWEIVKAEGGCSFVTSDSPVSFANEAVALPAEAGIAHVGTRVFFPLDSQHLLILSHPEYLDNPTIAPLEIVPDPVLGDGTIPLIYERTWNNAQVNRHNWCMLYLSDKLIVGRSKDTLEKAIDPEPWDHSYIHRGF
jgi:hypothetical protein